MAHTVFISYAVEDKEVAGKVCESLEEQGIKCWIAPRDVPYGADYEEAIVDAITASPLLVLILSAHSNASAHVKREIQNACAEGTRTRILPLRIDNVTYSKPLRYYLGSAQWLDASAPPLENHLRRLVEYVRAQLLRPPEPEVSPRPRVMPDESVKPDSVLSVHASSGWGGEKARVWIAAGGGVLLLISVILVVSAVRYFMSSDNTNDFNGGNVNYSPSNYNGANYNNANTVSNANAGNLNRASSGNSTSGGSTNGNMSLPSGNTRIENLNNSNRYGNGNIMNGNMSGNTNRSSNTNQLSNMNRSPNGNRLFNHN